MKVRRYKKVNKYLTFYRNHYGFHPPFQVVIDGSFCQKALKHKVNLSEQIPKYFGDQIRLYTTVCIINETQSLGRLTCGAHAIVKQFPIRKCGHSKNPVAGNECILSLIGTDNGDHLIVATNDLKLTDQLRSIPGCPILYLKLSAMNLEKPSQASMEHGEETKKKLLGSDEDQMKRLKALKEEVLGSEVKSVKKRKKGGPNPLSCKKKKKGQSDEQPKRKPNEDGNEKEKRKRKRVKIAKHVKKLLDSHNVSLEGD